MRPALLACGCLMLAAAWWAPQRLAGSSFSAHMATHMGVVAVAAPLLALAIAGARGDPVQRAPGLFAPIPASFLELVVVWAWHTPALHHAARQRMVWLVLEQATFLLTGLLLWLAAFGGAPSRRANRAAAGIVALLLTSMHMTLLGALLALTPRPLYVHAGGSSRLAPLADQQLGGAIMILVGGIAYLVGGLVLVRGLLRSAPLADRPRESPVRDPGGIVRAPLAPAERA